MQLVGCGLKKNELIGKYSFQGTNTIDYLVLEKDIYIHKIYNKDLKLVYESQNKWELENQRITLYGFYSNEDDIFEEFLSNEAAKKFLVIASFPVYKENKNLVIEANSDEGIIYKKIKLR
ncbi:hypothetical protein [Chryseobacterium sp. T1]